MNIRGYESDLKKFNDICEDLKTCKFILAEIRITKLLKCLSDSDFLYAKLEECLDEFNFDFEFQKAKVPSNEQDGKFNLILPIEPSNKVALIFHILYLIDTKEIDLQQFINKFYYHEDEPYQTYKNFANHLIDEFQMNYEYLITGIMRLEENPVVRYNDDLRLQDKTIVDLVEILKKINAVLSEDEFKLGQKEEMLIVTNGFSNALITLNPEHILICWVGFKNTMKEHKKFMPYLKRIEEKLKKSGIFSV